MVNLVVVFGAVVVVVDVVVTMVVIEDGLLVELNNGRRLVVEVYACVESVTVSHFAANGQSQRCRFASQCNPGAHCSRFNSPRTHL